MLRCLSFYITKYLSHSSERLFNEKMHAMKQYLHQFLLVMFTLCLSFSFSNGQTHSQVEYPSTDTLLTNPERGFYHHHETHTGSYTALNVNTLKGYREEGISLILRLFYLGDFVSSPISTEYLAKMEKDFQNARQAGVKMVLRFAYTKSMSQPYGDATPQWVKRHINQLSEILEANSDVIAAIQAGFIGAWGEWYYTDHFSELPGYIKEEDWEERRMVTFEMLDKFPQNRMIQIRTPYYKQIILNDSTALTQSEAFSGSYKARLAHHNDCFLSSPNDVGTYRDTTLEKPYLSKETRFLVMGGETCSTYPPLTDCPNALKEMDRFHWSYLNSGYHPDVLDGWESQGCMDTITNSLGYRYRMTEAQLQDQAKPNGAVQLTIDMVNDGFANVYNERDVHFILRNTSTRKEYVARSKADPRLFNLDDTTTIDFTAGLPATIEPGEYQVFIHLPDPDIKISQDPRYAIRLANKDIWEDSTGYNNLMHTITVDNNFSQPDYQGTNHFEARKASSPHQTLNITADGDPSDWTGSESYTSASGQPAQKLYVYHDTDSLYFLVEGDQLQQDHLFYLDWDNNDQTGEQLTVWNSNGMDYRILNGTLESYNSNTQTWDQVAPVVQHENVNNVETSLAFDLLPATQTEATIRLSYQNDPTDGSPLNMLPVEGSQPVEYHFRSNQRITLLSTSYSDQAILSWGVDTSNFLRVIERSTDPTQDFQEIARINGDKTFFIDEGLSTDQPYYYRMFLTNNQVSTPYSNITEVQATGDSYRYSQIQIDGNREDWNAIPASYGIQQDTSVLYYKIYSDSKDLNILISGNDLQQYALFLNASSSGESLEEWHQGQAGLRVSNDSVYTFNDPDWSFADTTANVYHSDTLMEISIDLSKLPALEGFNIIRHGLVVQTSKDQVVLPHKTRPMAQTIRALPPAVPSGVEVNPSTWNPETELNISWDDCPNCSGYVLERSTDEENFTEIETFNQDKTSYSDGNLQTDQTYYYRLYSYNGAGKSDYSTVVSGTPSVTGMEDQARGEIKLYNRENTIIVEIPDVARKEQATLFLFDVNGRMALQENIHLHQEQTTYHIRHDLNPGIYFVKLVGDLTNLTGEIFIR
jgi:hypothetical protein